MIADGIGEPAPLFSIMITLFRLGDLELRSLGSDAPKGRPALTRQDVIAHLRETNLSV